LDRPVLNAAGGAKGLVYLDVWDREITATEDPDITEKALNGVDTATRLKTIWQVKVQHGDSPSCDTDFSKLFEPSAGRLSVDTDKAPPPDDPCLLPDSPGFRDIENRHYRVEIHSVDPGTGAATFKFSREGASIVSPVGGISAAGAVSKLKVKRIGRDSVLRFGKDDWVEITDDRRFLSGRPGVMARIAKPPDEDELTIELDRDISGENISNDPTEAPRVIRWDQRDLDTRKLDANGLIAVALNAPIPLERGIVATFTLEPAGGRFHVGDFWLFPARVIDASAGPLKNAPPRGIVHHYATLATVTGLGTAIKASPCPHLYPPDQPGGADCECSVCVTPEEQRQNSGALQNAIEKVKALGGKVCLHPGFYGVSKPIDIRGAAAVKLTGHGLAIIANINPDGGPVIVVEDSLAITIEALILLEAATEKRNDALIAIGNCPGGVTVQDCLLVAFDLRAAARAPKRGAGIELFGGVAAVSILRNVVAAGTGIESLAIGQDQKRAKATAGSFLSFDVQIRDNAFDCGNFGISLEGFGFSMDIDDNVFTGAEEAAIHVGGFTRELGVVGITGNAIDIAGIGNGIEVAIDDARIVGNTISRRQTGGEAAPVAAGSQPRGSGIAVIRPPVENDIDRCHILSNRILGVAGNAIWFVTRVTSAMVKQNFIEDAGGGGIVVDRRSRLARISIENNYIARVGRSGGDADEQPAAGISVFETQSADISANEIVDVGRVDRPTGSAGILAAFVGNARIAGNTISSGNPVSGLAAGIAVLQFDRVEVTGNVVHREPAREEGDTRLWFALFVAGRQSGRRPSGLIDIQGVTFSTSRGVIRRQSGMRGIVLVNGNVFEVVGATPNNLVAIVTGESCTFTDNICTISMAGDDLAESLVSINAPVLIVTSNQAAGGTIDLDLTSRSDPDRWTVLGNVAVRMIHLNGKDLPPPWHDLNRSL
ncbi:MAG TPA: DUF6519 domain-containing protein, partial [Thermoanaerobaculia bacterium]|nr:DUF6519 domain-containing protein [Thermoanaerobaculia bacterium]